MELWPVTGYGESYQALILSMVTDREKCYLCALNTTLTVITVTDISRPFEWLNTTSVIPSPHRQLWFSGIVNHEGWIYIYGHTDDDFYGPIILRRHRFERLLQHDWTNGEIWAKGGHWMHMQSDVIENDMFEILNNLTMWENTILWSHDIQKWTTFSNNDIHSFQLWTSDYLQGPWMKHGEPMYVKEINRSQPDNLLCYAMKHHAELKSISYVCNVWSVVDEPDFHIMNLEQRLYWPIFVNVNYTSPSITYDNKNQLIFEQLLPDPNQIGYLGGDCAASLQLNNDMYLWVFCDTYLGEFYNNRRYPQALPWNTIAVMNVSSSHVRAYWKYDTAMIL